MIAIIVAVAGIVGLAILLWDEYCVYHYRWMSGQAGAARYVDDVDSGREANYHSSNQFGR